MKHPPLSPEQQYYEDTCLAFSKKMAPFGVWSICLSNHDQWKITPIGQEGPMWDQFYYVIIGERNYATANTDYATWLYTKAKSGEGIPHTLVARKKDFGKALEAIVRRHQAMRDKPGVVPPVEPELIQEDATAAKVITDLTAKYSALLKDYEKLREAHIHCIEKHRRATQHCRDMVGSIKHEQYNHRVTATVLRDTRRDIEGMRRILGLKSIEDQLSEQNPNAVKDVVESMLASLPNTDFETRLAHRACGSHCKK